MLVEYWWNPKIEKYMFKCWFQEEKAWQGVANKTVEGGLKSMQNRWPDYDFELKEVESA